MPRLPLSGGAYPSASPLANQMACKNIYPEANPKDSPTPFTYYQRPGLKPKVTDGTTRPVRGLYNSSQNSGFCAIGNTIYKIASNFTITSIGTIGTTTGPVCFADNGITMVIVDGSATGYSYIFSSNTFATIVDPTGIFTGANQFGYMDTFMVWNVPNSPTFGSTLSNVLTFDALYTAAKTVYPDLLKGIIVNRHEILLLGTQTGEIWYNVGAATFPFAILPGAFIEHGCLATYSIAYQDIEVYWLGVDQQGTAMVLCQKGYNTTRISNHAVEAQLQAMVEAGIDLSDAIGYTYQYRGHIFYVLTFPTGDQTWVYDATIGDPTGAWHQRTWIDGAGAEHRDRTNCYAFMYGKKIAGDWQYGQLYEMDNNTYQDTVNGVVASIKCVRTFPQILSGMDQEQQQSILADGKVIQVNKFTADISCGTAPLVSGNADSVSLRWSTDRGFTFGTPVPLYLGIPGEYSNEPRAAPLGIGRWWVLELTYTANGPVQLNGGWVDVTILAN